MASTPSTVLNTNPQALRVVITNEKVTGPPAAEMVRRSGIASSGTTVLRVLDNACGGGVLTAEVLKLARHHPDSLNLRRMVAGDIDEGMLDYVRNKRKGTDDVQRDVWSGVEVMVIDQQSIPLRDRTLTHVFSNFGIFFCQDDEKALQEAYQVLRHCGTLGLTTWKTIAWWAEVAQPAIAQYIPGAPTLPPSGQIFPQRGWSNPEAIPPKLEKAGFGDVRVTEYTFTPDVEADEFAEAAGVLVNVVTKKLWSEEQTMKFADQVEPALLRYLRKNFEGGKWDGKMTAIITLARKPRHQMI